MGKQSAYFDVAEDFYVFDGLTLEAIAARLGPDGPSITSLSAWKQKGEWDRLRSEWALSQAEKKRDRRESAQKLAKAQLKILGQEVLSPQDIYAVTAIERCLAQGEKKDSGEAAAPEIDRPTLFLENLKFIADVLKGEDPEGLKILARNFDLIVTRFKATLTEKTKNA